MKNLKRLLYYLLINLFVSVCATFAVLLVWERTHPGAFGVIELPGISSLSSPTPSSARTPDPTDQAISASLLPSLTPTLALAAYRVQEGDSLGTIAEQFQTTIAQLVAINAIDDPDALGAGQVIYVPAPPATETVSSTPEFSTPEPAPPASPSGLAGAVVSGVFGAGDLETERLRLECRDQAGVSLEGWQLMDEDGHSYTFPDLELFPGGAVDIFTRQGANDVVSLYWGLAEAVWQPGETVTLRNASGEIQATYKVP